MILREYISKDQLADWLIGNYYLNDNPLTDSVQLLVGHLEAWKEERWGKMLDEILEG